MRRPGLEFLGIGKYQGCCAQLGDSTDHFAMNCCKAHIANPGVHLGKYTFYLKSIKIFQFRAWIQDYSLWDKAYFFKKIKYLDLKSTEAVIFNFVNLS